jgi:hypothetical protein
MLQTPARGAAPGCDAGTGHRFALAVYEGITYFIRWVIVGAAIGLIYKTS